MSRRKNDPPTKQRCVRLTDEQCRLLRTWGRGDLSAGLRWLIDTAQHLIVRGDVAPPLGAETKEDRRQGVTPTDGPGAGRAGQPE